MKKKLRISVMAGGPSIILIFLVLCLTTLGILSLVTAKTGLGLTEKTSEHTVDYYRADGMGEEFLASVDAMVRSGVDIEAFSELDSTTASKSNDGSILLDYMTDLNDNQMLHIELLIPAFSENESKTPTYQIQSWKVENKEYWNYDEYQIQIDGQITE